MSAVMRSERGATLVLVASFWLILAGIASLVVDLGLVRARRADAQVAADAAALASLDGVTRSNPSVARQVALDMVVANGFGFEDVVVSIPPSSGRRSGDNRCVEVQVADDFNSLFSSLLGVDRLRASARAVACADVTTVSSPAIFAASTVCDDKNLRIASSTLTIIGDVHSNDSIELSGSTSTFEGEFSWNPNSYFIDSGADNHFDRLPRPHAPRGWPVQFLIEDYAPGGRAATAALSMGRYYNSGTDDMSIGWLIDHGAYDPNTNVLQPGLYYSEAKIDLSDSDITIAGGGGITLVSSGSEINLAGSDHQLRPFVDDVLIFADYQKQLPQSSSANCDSSAASISGSNSDWEGIVYVPRGQVKLSGSSNTSLSGAVLAYTIEFSGQDLRIDATGLTESSPATTKLVE